MRVNWRRFFFVFLLLESAFVLSGCTAAWLSAVASLLPALETVVSAIISFVVTLEGKTISPAVTATIKKIGSDIAAEIVNVQALIAAFQKSASTGLLSQIQAVFQAIVDNLGQILTAANITDSSTIAKITQLVGLAVDAAQAIIALIPMAVSALQSKNRSVMEQEDKVPTQAIDKRSNLLKETYVAIVTQHTTNVDVNAALDALPRSI